MLLDDSSWPTEIRWIRQQFVEAWQSFIIHDQAGIGYRPAHIDHALGASPRFFVARDQTLILSVAGKSGWETQVAPLLTTLVGN